MSFRAFHHSIISASETWRALSSYCEENTRVTLSFEISFIRYADINDGIPEISVVRHIAQHQMIIENLAYREISGVVHSFML